MTYTGNVKVGGPSDTREIDGLTVTKLAVGPMDNNAYLLRDTSTGEGVLIDAANEPERIIEMVGDVPITWLVTTHRHYDHWQALKQVHEAIGGVVVAQTEDAPELPIPVDDDLSDGDILRFGDAAVSVIHLRGHTPGSVAILYDAEGRLADSPHLFTGDSLFPGGPGKT
ncbi:MAG TPA: MBL fold metallo-hydrolase, partial [Streptosporangiaceae bacterium]|nr:MBL fold metallo-hydrolase [Streptosporangiaceae bacterium]